MSEKSTKLIINVVMIFAFWISFFLIYNSVGCTTCHPYIFPISPVIILMLSIIFLFKSIEVDYKKYQYLSLFEKIIFFVNMSPFIALISLIIKLR